MKDRIFDTLLAQFMFHGAGVFFCDLLGNLDQGEEPLERIVAGGADWSAYEEPKTGGLKILKTRDRGDIVPLASARDEASTSTTH